ncbi:MAG: sigma-70 family RNA polymerase sigma factor [Verrucomicrobiales bacterium]|nr:sigma-70 family RNA polymerase sigma factor [Verrucomicrobiales bacterium]
MDPLPFEPEVCLAKVRLGNEEAARALVEHLHPLVMKIVRSHLPRRAAEEDLAQEVFARVFERLGQYTPRAGVPLEHWVARLAVRTCLDALRSERRRPELRCADLSEAEAAWFETLVDPSPEAHPAQSAEASSARELVDRLLESLGPEDRLVLRLLDLEELSVADVSRWTGWSAVSVRVRAFRARQRLRRVVENMKFVERP